jgi:hypothetical protein
MDRGSIGQHDYVFRNVGKAPLDLIMGETTCKCTAAAAGGRPMGKGDKQTVPPGGSFKVTLDWRIKSEDPHFSQSAEFRTNDPRREIVRLLIVGKTVPAIEPEEPDIRFTNVSISEPAVAELNLYSYRDQELKIVKHDWMSDDHKELIEATFSPLPAKEAQAHSARGGVKMRIALKPGFPIGRTRQGIVLRSNYEGIEPVKIPISILVVGDLTVLGPRVMPDSTTVHLGLVEQKTGRKHTVFLLIKGPHRQATTAEVAQVEPSAWLKVTLGEPLTDSPNVKRIPITIDIPAGAPLGNFSGTDDGKTGRIVLRTTHPQVKEVVIPVEFLIRE